MNARNGRLRRALTLRGIEREYGISRHFAGRLVREGAFPALRRGRSLLVLREDFEGWWRRQARQLPGELERRVEEALDWEEMRAGG